MIITSTFNDNFLFVTAVSYKKMANMAEDFDFICSKIEEEKEFLDKVSQEIWKTPELQYNEIQAHAFLSKALSKYGFEVEKHYLLNTAFKSKYESKEGSGPTVAILLEYDALPEIGHACGHNLISEAGLAASMAVKSLMEHDPTLLGKLVVMGTPAEEGGGGKLKLIEKGAFKDIDVALMVHPTSKSCASPPCLCLIRGTVVYRGKEAHAAGGPWEGRNALDAAVLCYNNISVLRQQIKPAQRIHIIITEGGTAINIIPAKSVMKICIRTPTTGELKKLRARVEMCITSAAQASGCEVNYEFDEATSYQNLISNKILSGLFQEHFEKLGYPCISNGDMHTGSTDMGNVSHIMPSIHPFFAIPTKGINHTKEFTEASGSPEAQKSTLAAAKAMAMTAVAILRDPSLLEEAKKYLEIDVINDETTN